MEETKDRKPLSKLLILILAAVVLVGIAAAVIFLPDRTDTGPGQETSVGTTEETVDVPTVALPTRYIVLSYPAEIAEDVKASCEDLKDGQKVTFTTDFTGEELELFQFVISKSDSEGYPLGVLKDEQAGDLFVCVNVSEYSQGNWEVADYTKLNALQERVNDIIMQFHQDPRFTPSNSQSND